MLGIVISVLHIYQKERSEEVVVKLNFKPISNFSSYDSPPQLCKFSLSSSLTLGPTESLDLVT